MPDREPYDLSPTEAAAFIGCHPETLKLWAAEGKINAFKTPGGWWKFRRSDIDAFLTSGGNRADVVEPTAERAS